MNKKTLILITTAVGILFFVIAFIYFTRSAERLPAFFPGYQAGLTKLHYKHGIGAIILAMGAFVFAWFQSGKKSTEKK